MAVEPIELVCAFFFDEFTLREPDIIFPIFTVKHSIMFCIQITLIYSEGAAFHLYLLWAE